MITQNNRANRNGMALIAVLWIVSVLSLLATALIEQTKTEIRVAALAKSLVIEEANGKAAIALVLQKLKFTGVFPSKITKYQAEFNGVRMLVKVIPANGFIDLNRSPPNLLKTMLRVSAKLSDIEASKLVDTIVEKRKKSQTQSGVSVAFEANEDLLQVRGFTYPIYQTVNDVVTVNAQGSGRVNPLAAPKNVLLILADGNLAIASDFDASRENSRSDNELDMTGFNSEYVERSDVKRFKIDVYAEENAKYTILSKYVDIREDRRVGQMWRILN